MLEDAEDLGNVRVIERGERLRLTCEPREAVGIGCEQLGQDLDCDVTLQLVIARTIHLAHARFGQSGPGAGARVGREGERSDPPAPIAPVISYGPRRCPAAVAFGVKEIIRAERPGAEDRAPGRCKSFVESVTDGQPDAPITAIDGPLVRNLPVAFTRPSGMPKLRVLVALNISTRNCMLWPFRNRVFFVSEKSRLPMPSARSELRATLPTRSAQDTAALFRPPRTDG